MKIIYQDKNVVVIDKPAGIAVHPAHGIPSGETIIERLKKLGLDVYLVHRLDKDTSGVMIFAKTPTAKEYLQRQFRDRKVKKTYLALVEGELEHLQAILTYPIARHPKNPLKRAVRGSGKPAETKYKVVKTFGSQSSQIYTLVEVRPKTGRTHQIRVQMAYIGHPVIGDGIYGKTDKLLQRHFLHASVLEIDLPNAKAQHFECALPKELEEYLANLV